MYYIPTINIGISYHIWICNTKPITMNKFFQWELDRLKDAGQYLKLYLSLVLWVFQIMIMLLGIVATFTAIFS